MILKRFWYDMRVIAQQHARLLFVIYCTTVTITCLNGLPRGLAVGSLGSRTAFSHFISFLRTHLIV